MNNNLARICGSLAVLAASMSFVAIVSAQTVKIPAVTVQVTASPVSTTASTTCPLITSFMQMGYQNNPAQVTLLQTFLKNTEHLDVDVTGVFDQKTQEAVMAFQKQYMSEIMGPWGATQASGKVNITTVKMINKIACGMPLSLNSTELAALAAYQAKMASGTMETTTFGPTMTVMIPTTTASAEMSAPNSGQNGSSMNSQMADVGATMQSGSLMHRFKEFLLHVF